MCWAQKGCFLRVLRNQIRACELTVVFLGAFRCSFASNLGSRTACPTMNIIATQSKLHFFFINDSQKRHRVRTSDARKVGNFVQRLLFTNNPAIDVRRAATCCTFLRAVRSRLSFFVRLLLMGPLSVRTWKACTIRELARIWCQAFTLLNQNGYKGENADDHDDGADDDDDGEDGEIMKWFYKFRTCTPRSERNTNTISKMNMNTNPNIDKQITIFVIIRILILLLILTWLRLIIWTCSMYNAINSYDYSYWY